VTVHAAVGEDTDRRSDNDQTEDIGLVADGCHGSW
jgi:hypothetical protein